jgi:hypothetical protein
MPSGVIDELPNGPKKTMLQRPEADKGSCSLSPVLEPSGLSFPFGDSCHHTPRRGDSIGYYRSGAFSTASDRG